VEPDGLESEPSVNQSLETDDPLLQLFRGESLTSEQFREALHKQRSAAGGTIGNAAAAQA
jgi:hypothetical protein